MKRLYMIYVLLAFLPELSGCFWQEFHLKGEVDATGNPIEKEEKGDTEKEII